ncbi:MAG: sigma-70 family RNA polymerase sigma factor [Polyangiales bacterium]
MREPCAFVTHAAPDAIDAPGAAAADDDGDGALVGAVAREGCRPALAKLYDRHAPTMLALATKMLRQASRREAEDLLHDVFLEVWRQAATYDPARGTVRSWLMVRLRSRALDRLKASRRSGAILLGDVELEDRQLGLADDPSATADHGAVRGALADLPPDLRVVLELGYFAGLSSSEIAAAIGAPVGTVKSRAAAARAPRRVAFTDDEPTSVARVRR